MVSKIKSSLVRGVYSHPLLFLSPVLQVSHPFPMVGHPYSQLDVTNKVLFGTISNVFAVFIGNKTEIGRNANYCW